MRLSFICWTSIPTHTDALIGAQCIPSRQIHRHCCHSNHVLMPLSHRLNHFQFICCFFQTDFFAFFAYKLPLFPMPPRPKNRNEAWLICFLYFFLFFSFCFNFAKWLHKNATPHDRSVEIEAVAATAIDTTTQRASGSLSVGWMVYCCIIVLFTSTVDGWIWGGATRTGAMNSVEIGLRLLERQFGFVVFNWESPIWSPLGSAYISKMRPIRP